MDKFIKPFRKAGIFITGVSVIVIGIILLPLPGPGLLIIFGGLVILSLEFEWAAKHRDGARKKLKEIIDKSKQGQPQAKTQPKSKAKPKK